MLETIKRLFFEWAYSRKCIHNLLQWLGKWTQLLDVKGIWRRLDRGTKGKGCRELVMVALAGLVYTTWKAAKNNIFE